MYNVQPNWKIYKPWVIRYNDYLLSKLRHKFGDQVLNFKTCVVVVGSFSSDYLSAFDIIGS